MSEDNPKGGMASTKPYLIRALYEWCVDQGFTPYLSVMVDRFTQVPKPYVKDNQIVLNLSPEAVHQLVMGNDFISCSARFGGVAQSIMVPIGRVAALYARENGNGMAFDVEDTPEIAETVELTEAETPEPASPDSPSTAPSSSSDKPTRPKSGGRPHLTRVK